MSSSTERSDINNHDYKQDLIIPKLRNNLFKDNWSTKKLGDISKIIMGQSPSSSNYSDDTDDTILIQGNQDLNNGLVVPRIYTSEITKISKPGDIILTVRAPVGDIAINEYDCCIGRGVCSITPHENKLFIYYYLQYLNNKKIWNKYSQGSTFESVNSKDIKNLKIKIPSINEQNYISEFLSSIDKKIEFMEKKYLKLISYKRNLLNNTFSKTFDKYEKLNKITFYQEGPGVRNYQYTKKGIKLLNVSNFENNKLNLSNTDRFISEEEAYGKYNHFLVDEGDLLIACSGIKAEYFDEKIAFAEKQHLPLCMNTSTMRFKSLDENKLNLDYLKYFFQSQKFKKEVFRVMTGSAQFNFGPTHLKYFNIPLPSINKQNQIKRTFLSFDRKLAYIEKEIQLNKEFKRSLLSKMFC